MGCFHFVGILDVASTSCFEEREVELDGDLTLRGTITFLPGLADDEPGDFEEFVLDVATSYHG